MDKWKITKDAKGWIHVRLDPDKGKIAERDKAVALGKKIAQENKTHLIVHDDVEATKSDYTNFLTLEEIQGRQENEVKLARAELTVAQALLWKHKQAYYRAKTPDQKRLARQAYEEAKIRVQKEKANLKNAKKKYAEVLD